MNKELNIFNTLSGQKEKFVPINKEKVGMYVCGPTVYDFPHIGNARPLVVFDVLDLNHVDLLFVLLALLEL